VLSVREQGGVLQAQATGQGAFPLTASGADTFEAPAFGIELRFARDAAGNVQSLELHQGGQVLRGQNGLCLDVSGGLRAGNPLIAYRCSGGDNQRFTWTPYGELRAGSLCLDVEGGSQREGARVVAWECRDQPNQKWAWDRGAIRSQYTGMCLDIQGGRARSGQPVVMWPCSGSASQRWN